MEVSTSKISMSKESASSHLEYKMWQVCASTTRGLTPSSERGAGVSFLPPEGRLRGRTPGKRGHRDWRWPMALRFGARFFSRDLRQGLLCRSGYLRPGGPRAIRIIRRPYVHDNSALRNTKSTEASACSQSSAVRPSLVGRRRVSERLCGSSRPSTCHGAAAHLGAITERVVRRCTADSLAAPMRRPK